VKQEVEKVKQTIDFFCVILHRQTIIKSFVIEAKAQSFYGVRCFFTGC